jgi:hypothetical protein
VRIDTFFKDSTDLATTIGLVLLEIAVVEMHLDHYHHWLHRRLNVSMHLTRCITNALCTKLRSGTLKVKPHTPGATLNIVDEPQLHKKLLFADAQLQKILVAMEIQGHNRRAELQK